MYSRRKENLQANSGNRLRPPSLANAILRLRSQGGINVNGVLSRDAGGGQRRWKFEAVAQVVRLLVTIEAPGSPGHLSRPSDEGKVVEPKPCE